MLLDDSLHVESPSVAEEVTTDADNEQALLETDQPKPAESEDQTEVDPNSENPEELTDEEKAAKEEEEKQALARKREQGKISKLERERNELQKQVTEAQTYREAFTFVQDLKSDSWEERISELYADPKKYEKLQPHLAAAFPEFPVFANDHNTFRQTIEKRYNEQAQSNPQTLERVQKLQQKQVETQYLNQFEEAKKIEEAKLDLKYSTMYSVNGYREYYSSNPGFAEQEFNLALQTVASKVQIMQLRGVDNIDVHKLLADEIQSLHPEFNQKAVKQAQNGLEANLLNTIKGTTSNAPQAPANNPDLSNFGPKLQNIYNDRMQIYIDRGLSQKEAHKKALEFINDI